MRILIYRLGSLGDTVLVLPALRAIRNKYPESSITLLTNLPISEKAAPIPSILESTGLIDRTIDYPLGTRSVREFLKLARELRNADFDMMFYLAAYRGLMSVLRDWIYFSIFASPIIYGLPLRKADRILLRDEKTPNLYEWEAKRIARRIKRGVSVDLNSDLSWDLQITSKEKSLAKALLSEDFLKCQVIVVCFGTKNSCNDWGEDKWASFRDLLAKSNPDCGIVVVGTKQEHSRGERFLSGWSGKGINLCGKTNPRETAAVMMLCKVYIGHDSGPLHLAAAVGAQCVGVYGARNMPGHWFPRAGKSTVIYKNVDCRGCGLQDCLEKGKICIRGISSEEVHSAVRAKIWQ